MYREIDGDDAEGMSANGWADQTATQDLIGLETSRDDRVAAIDGTDGTTTTVDRSSEERSSDDDADEHLP